MPHPAGRAWRRLPGPLVFAEHLAMRPGFRAASKSLGGFDWIPFATPAPAAEPASVSSIAREGIGLDEAA